MRNHKVFVLNIVNKILSIHNRISEVLDSGHNSKRTHLDRPNISRRQSRTISSVLVVKVEPFFLFSPYPIKVTVDTILKILIPECIPSEIDWGRFFPNVKMDLQDVSGPGIYWNTTSLQQILAFWLCSLQLSPSLSQSSGFLNDCSSTCSLQSTPPDGFLANSIESV